MNMTYVCLAKPCEADARQALDIGAGVHLRRTALRKLWDQQPNRPTLFHGQRHVPEPIGHDRGVRNRGERDGNGERTVGRAECGVGRLWADACRIEERPEADATTLSATN